MSRHSIYTRFYVCVASAAARPGLVVLHHVAISGSPDMACHLLSLTLSPPPLFCLSAYVPHTVLRALSQPGRPLLLWWLSPTLSRRRGDFHAAYTALFRPSLLGGATAVLMFIFFILCIFVFLERRIVVGCGVLFFGGRYVCMVRNFCPLSECYRVILFVVPRGSGAGGVIFTRGCMLYVAPG